MDEGALPILAIVGRPNVGKSALFNRILGRRVSIVHEQSGVTRDRIAAPASYRGRHFLLMDTGGLGDPTRERNTDVFDSLIREQVLSLVEEASVIVLVVDCQTGLVPLDQEVADLLRDAGVQVVVALNKADNATLSNTGEAEFSPLGFADLMPTSCTHNRGIEQLLKACVPKLPAAAAPDLEKPGLRVAVVGRPNVGKSSLVNRLLGEDRVMVSDVAGTTRDAVDVPFRLLDGEEEVPATLIDTAGLRRRRNVDTAVEFFSVTRAEKAIGRSDVVVFVTESGAPATAQDRRIANLIGQRRKPCIIVVNKWDLVRERMRGSDLEALVRDGLPFMQHAPIVLTCALDGFHMESILEHLLRLREQMQVTIPTSVLNRFIQDAVARTPPPSVGNRFLKVFYATMVGNPPPHFLLFINHRRCCPANYLQFLENQIRKAFFPEAGLPIWLETRERRRGDAPADGQRRAIAGVKRKEARRRSASARHESRRKGWRKRR